MTTSQHLELILSRFSSVKKRREGEWMVICPAHSDGTASLSIGVGKSGRILLHCFAGCKLDTILTAAGLSRKDLYQSNSNSTPTSRNVGQLGGRAKETTFRYSDADGALRFEVVRTDTPKGKRFHQRAPDLQGAGGWKRTVQGKLTMEGVQRILYNLAAIVKAETVWIVEGEQCADALIALGLAATTNVGGAGKWLPEYAEDLRGKRLRILPDNDPVGRQHGEDVANQLADVSSDIRIVTLPDLPTKGDIVDWLAQGHTIRELKEIADMAEAWPQREQILADESKTKAAGRTQESGASSTASIQTTSQRLVAIGMRAELFHSDRDEGYANFVVGGHRETWPLRHRYFKGWLTREYFHESGRAPGSQSMEDAIRVLDAQARFDGRKQSLAVRATMDSEATWLDLGDVAWRAVRIDSEGWRIVDEPPPLFRREASQLAQCNPERGGNLDRLRAYVNVQDDDAYHLMLVWMVASFIPNIAHPILVVHGEQGTAKSTLMRLLISLIDPSKTPLRSEPRSQDEWVITADHSWLVTLDNLSRLPGWLSDALCRAVTGDGFSKRQLYSDTDEVILAFRRVIALTGIDVVATRPDLLDRSVLLELDPIPGSERRLETEVLAGFEHERPAILGALLDTVSSALRQLPEVQLSPMPRMADFARVGVAVERVLGWEDGSFLLAYAENIGEQNDEAIAASLVAQVIRKLMQRCAQWEGSATELRDTLFCLLDRKSDNRDWPKTPRQLSGELRRIAPNLRKTGVEVNFRNPHGKRIITLGTVLMPSDSIYDMEEYSIDEMEE